MVGRLPSNENAIDAPELLVKMVDFMLRVFYHRNKDTKLQEGCESSLEVTRDFDERGLWRDERPEAK